VESRQLGVVAVMAGHVGSGVLGVVNGIGGTIDARHGASTLVLGR
jgi:hypothetical protein